MTTSTKPNTLTHEGQDITAVVGPVVIKVSCIRPGYAYRLSIFQAGPVGTIGTREIDELSRSYPTEREARHAARTATILVRAGWTVQDLIQLVAAFAV